MGSCSRGNLSLRAMVELVEVTVDWGMEGWLGVCEAEKRGKGRLGLPKHGQRRGDNPSLNLSSDSHTSSPLGQMGDTEAQSSEEPSRSWVGLPLAPGSGLRSLGASTCSGHSHVPSLASDKRLQFSISYEPHSHPDKWAGEGFWSHGTDEE